MRPRILLLSLTLSVFCTARAQYADLGTGTLKNQIWWLDWTGFTLTEGASKTIVTNNGLTIKATFTNVSNPNYFIPSRMDAWAGTLLKVMYNFSNTNILPGLFDGGISPHTGSYHYDMTITVTRNGNPVPFTLVTSDDEGTSLDEQTTINTNGSPWTTLEFLRTSSQTDDPLIGCNTQSAKLVNTHYDASTLLLDGQIPIIATTSPGTNPLLLNLILDHGTTNGGMAMAYGIFTAVDRGDLPVSYGTVQHELSYTTTNGCNYLAPFPQTVPVSPLRIGAVPGDADPAEQNDDNASGADEDGIASFPVYNNNGTYTLNVPVGNTTGNDAYLTGWFDFNRNGQFDPGESVTATVPANAASATLSWTGLPTWLPVGTTSGYGFRLRLSSDKTATQSATGYAPDGEVEDYFVPSAVLCNITVTALPDTSVCPKGSIPARASGATQYAWTGGSGISNPSIATPVISPSSDATYTVTGSNPQGCQASANIQVTIYPLPVVAITNDTTICQGKQITLTASGGLTNTWTSSSGMAPAVSPSITVSPTSLTRYYVQVTDGNSCSSFDSTDVAIHAIPSFDLNPKTPSVCKNDTTLLTASGGDLYAWSSATGPIPGNGPLLQVVTDASIDVMVDITDIICQLSNTLTAHITVLPSPVTSITKSNDIDCQTGQAILHATGGVTYAWDTAPGISDLGSSDPVVRPAGTTMYYVTIFGANGCHARDSITVKADFASALSNYPLPNAFTPNNDGHNDCFGINKYWGSLTSVEIEVFDRWGVRVFMSRTPGDCWDGNYKGVPQPSGTYVYQIRATTPCGVAYRKGTVLLIR